MFLFCSGVGGGRGAADDDGEGRQPQPCEATAFEQTPIADGGKPYRPQPNDSKPTKTETTSPLPYACLQGESYDISRHVICQLPPEAGYPAHIGARLKNKDQHVASTTLLAVGGIDWIHQFAVVG